jgi:hypothetical protein
VFKKVVMCVQESGDIGCSRRCGDCALVVMCVQGVVMCVQESGDIGCSRRCGDCALVVMCVQGVVA